MKKYSVKTSPAAEKAIKKLDLSVQKRIKKWIDDNLKECENPRLKENRLEVI